MHSRITLLLAALALAILSPVSAYDLLNNAIENFCKGDKTFAFPDAPAADKSVETLPRGTPTGTLHITESVETECKLLSDVYAKHYHFMCTGKVTLDQMQTSIDNIAAAKALTDILIQTPDQYDTSIPFANVPQSLDSGKKAATRCYTFFCKGEYREITVILTLKEEEKKEEEE